jgi:hypothetical protein
VLHPDLRAEAIDSTGRAVSGLPVGPDVGVCRGTGHIGSVELLRDLSWLNSVRTCRAVDLGGWPRAGPRGGSGGVDGVRPGLDLDGAVTAGGADELPDDQAVCSCLVDPGLTLGAAASMIVKVSLDGL